VEYIGLLAPIAFVFALAALAQIGALRKELNRVFKTSVLSDVFYVVVLFGLALAVVLRFGGRTLTGRRK